MILGYDAAEHYQKELDYDALKAKGGKFIIIKAGEGYLDYKSQDYVKLAKDNGLLTGTYWYYRQRITWDGKDTWCDPVRQAQEYWKATKGNQDFPPALDIENTGNPYFRSDDILTCLQQVEKLFGRKPIIYTGYYIWQSDVGSPLWSDYYDLWLAQYRDTQYIKLPKPFTSWKIHQFSSSIKVSGTTIDHNYFNGDMEELLDYVNAPPLEIPEYVRVSDSVEWLSFRSRPERYKGNRPAIASGVPAKVLGKEETDINWYHVELSGGDKGYISAEPGYTIRI